MFCEKCHQREATGHVRGTQTFRLREGGAERTEIVLHDLCEICGGGGQTSGRPFSNPQTGAGEVTEKVRVVSVSPERTVLRLVRTEGESVPVEWSVLTDRLPKSNWAVGEQITMMVTPEEIDWLKGARESF